MKLDFELSQIRECTEQVNSKHNLELCWLVVANNLSHTKLPITSNSEMYKFELDHAL